MDFISWERPTDLLDFFVRAKFKYSIRFNSIRDLFTMNDEATLRCFSTTSVQVVKGKKALRVDCLLSPNGYSNDDAIRSQSMYDTDCTVVDVC